jgi:hypothetical protein
MQKSKLLGLAGLLAATGSLLFSGAATADPAPAPPMTIQAACNGTANPPGYFLHEAFVGSDTCTRCQNAAQYWKNQGRGTYCRYSNSFRAELYLAR